MSQGQWQPGKPYKSHSISATCDRRPATRQSLLRLSVETKEICLFSKHFSAAWANKGDVARAALGGGGGGVAQRVQHKNTTMN